MPKLQIEGLHPLEGTIAVHGAKNSVLPILSASLLADGVSEINNCPNLSDVHAAIAILRHLGCRAAWDDHCVTVDASNIRCTTIPDNLMHEMRSSIVFLGAVAARMGAVTLSFPGGCELGARPIDLHLSALRRLGMTIREEGGALYCTVKERLQGCAITLPFPSVGATENVLLAAVTARGETVLCNAAREPEITDLCHYLNALGARIHGVGDGTLYVEGVKSLHGCAYRVMPDRIETGTYLAAAAVTGGRLLLTGTRPDDLSAVMGIFEEMGCRLSARQNELYIEAPARLKRAAEVRTMPYPGFPTDMQAPLMTMACVAKGTSVFIETIFENRYHHVGELCRLGASVKVDGRVAIVEGVPRLSGAPVSCTDLRGGAAMVLAGLAAEGYTTVDQLAHIARGYEQLKGDLEQVGAHITWIES